MFVWLCETPNRLFTIHECKRKYLLLVSTDSHPISLKVKCFYWMAKTRSFEKLCVFSQDFNSNMYFLCLDRNRRLIFKQCFEELKQNMRVSSLQQQKRKKKGLTENLGESCLFSCHIFLQCDLEKSEKRCWLDDIFSSVVFFL